MKLKNILSIVLMCAVTLAFGQETEGEVNPNSLLRIPKYEQLYKVRVWRSIDLREKQNKGFFSRGNEITKLLIQAINSGELADIYEKDSLTTKKSKEDFYKSMESQQGTSYPAWNPTEDVYTPDRRSYNGKTYEALIDNKGKNPEASPNEWQLTTAGAAVNFLPSEIYRVMLMEDMIFDKRRSRLYYDMIAMEFSAFNVDKGVFVSLGWFKYKDLEKVFRNHPDEAIWFNRYNTAENRNYADAFLLRLFRGSLDKLENPDNDRIFDTYSNHKQAVWATEWEEMRLMEKEHNLWEY